LQNSYNNLIRFYLFILCAGQIRQVLEALGLTSPFIRVINVYGVYIFYPILLCIVVISSKATFKVGHLVLYSFLIGYPCLTLGYFYDVPYSPQYRLTDVLMPMFFFLTIAFARTSSLDFGFIFKTRWLQAYLVVSTVSILTALQFDIRYHSLASVQLLFLFSYYFYHKSFFTKYLVVFDIFLSGKRGLLVFVFSLISKLKFIQIMLVCVGVFVFVEFGLSPGKYINSLSLIGEVSFLEFLGARGKEISEVVFQLENEPLAFYTGFGSGFYYIITDSSGFIKFAHNVHFSPLGLISTYGVVYCVISYAFLIRMYVNSQKANPIFSMYLFLGLLYSLTAYSIFVDFLLLVSLCGIQNSKDRMSLSNYTQRATLLGRPGVSQIKA